MTARNVSFSPGGRQLVDPVASIRRDAGRLARRRRLRALQAALDPSAEEIVALRRKRRRIKRAHGGADRPTTRGSWLDGPLLPSQARLAMVNAIRRGTLSELEAERMVREYRRRA